MIIGVVVVVVVVVVGITSVVGLVIRDMIMTVHHGYY
jgi:hypothetical protein